MCFTTKNYINSLGIIQIKVLYSTHGKLYFKNKVKNTINGTFHFECDQQLSSKTTLDIAPTFMEPFKLRFMLFFLNPEYNTQNNCTSLYVQYSSCTVQAHCTSQLSSLRLGLYKKACTCLGLYGHAKSVISQFRNVQY